MFQVRFHGRGGQGVVTSAELLSVAAFNDGRHAQAFPVFGSERTGAPVMAFCRIDDRPIRTREPISRPDALVIQDATLLHAFDVFAGFQEGCVLVNTSRVLDLPGRVIAVAASDLAREHLGRPLPGAPLLGALAAALWIAAFLLSRYASVGSLVSAIALPFVALALEEPWSVIAFALLAGAAVVVLHRANIARLRAGTEGRFRFRRA